MNGTEDPVIPYRGGEASFHGWFSAGDVQSAEETIAFWKRVNAIDGAGTRTELPDRRPDDDSAVVERPGGPGRGAKWCSTRSSEEGTRSRLAIAELRTSSSA
jgi:poly(3-hydroxybutyrate) depolymerase